MRELIPLKTLTLPELQERLAEQGFARYRAAQILSWIYRHHARAFSEMTNIAKADRERLAASFALSSLAVVETERSSDGTAKLLFGLEDGHTIESVLIPEEKRLTLCVSSQVGCRQACRFCLTGAGGFVRNLRGWEIADQVLMVSRLLRAEGRPEITNIVFMGMGEPLDNFDELLRALAVITDDRAMGVSPRRITVSTCGLVPHIDRLGASRMRTNLAVSLNASTDAVRDRIMPVNKRYPLKELLAACRRYPLEPRRRITFEYVLLRGVNDSEEDAKRVAAMVKGIPCKLNLIPFNPCAETPFERPDDSAVRRFQKVLLDRHLTAPVRESRGRDISAACGQLRERSTTERHAAPAAAGACDRR
jgi:23S rRNA (adenine2503-C2)-methyltransferase